jgi:MoaA/NifB/PqqE/SkfB family radical SAM enzyme
MLKNKTADLLAQGATWVRISIDAANPELYAKTRAVSKRDFGKVCNNIKSFASIKRRDCELGINYIVNENNSGDVYTFLELARNLGVNHVKVSECVVSTKGEDNNRYQAPFLNSVKEQIIKAKDTLTNNHFAIIDKFHDFDDMYEKSYTRCPFIQFLTIIAADCNVYTCQDKAYTTSGKLGSIKDKSFKEMWCSDETQERLLSLNPSLECDHHCAQHGKNLMLLDYLDIDKDHLEFV